MIMVITRGYPYGGEPFLIAENKYTPEDTLYFSLSPDTYEITDPAFRGKAYRIHKWKVNILMALYALPGIFDRVFWSELISMKKRKKFSVKKIIAMVAFYGGAMRCYYGVRKHIKEEKLNEKTEIVYSYWMSYHAFVAAKIKKKYPKIKMITRCHGGDVYEFRPKTGYLPFRKFILESADSVYAVSNDLKNYLEKNFSEMAGNKISVLHLGTEEGRTNRNLPKDNIVRIISCSSMIPVKRIHKIILALGHIKKENVCWTHFGDGPLSEELKKSAEKLGDNIKWSFTGQKSNEEIISNYESNYYDIFVNTSESEGTPVSIMEAMSFGIPIVAPAVGGIDEMVIDRKNGFLLEPDFDEKKLADIICMFYGMHENEKKKFRENARKTWEENYDAAKNYRIFFEEITKAISTI